MKRTRLLAILLIALVTLSLVACNQTTLAAPERLTVENDTLRWNSVNGAKSYSIAVDGLEKAQTTNNYYSLDSLELEAGETYEFRVKAIGDGYIYLNSEFSRAYTFTYAPTANGGGNSGGGNTDSGNSGIAGSGGGNTDSGSSDSTSSYIPVKDTNEGFFYRKHPNTTPIFKDSFSDGAYYYYYYHLGYIENFPLVYSMCQDFTQEMKDSATTLSFSKTISAKSQDSIENTVTNSITKIKSGSSSIDKTFYVEVGVDGFITNSRGHSTNVATKWEWENSSTYATAHTVASSLTNGTEQSRTLTFNKDSKVGSYRYCQYADKCEVFVLVIYDVDTKKFTYDFLTYAPSIKNIHEAYEYSENGVFDSDIDAKNNLTFYESIIDGIDVNNPPKYKGPVIETPATPIEIPVNRHHCAHDTGYDLTTDGDSKNTVKDHSLYEMGHLVFYGCKKSGDIFRIAEPENFKLEYIFEQDPSNLPSTGSGDLRISDDSSKTVLDTSIRNMTIGQGAYEVKIKYKDGSTAKTVTVTDFMEGKSRGSVVDMFNGQLNGVDLSKVAEIKVTVVYELYYWANIGDHHHSDWRCDYVFIFE